MSISGTDSNSSNGSINLLFSPVRRGSACRQLHPLPTIVQADLAAAELFKVKKYIKSNELTEDEIESNNRIYEEMILNEFPPEDMIDKSFRDKVREASKKLEFFFLEIFYLGQGAGSQVLGPQRKCQRKHFR